MTLTIGSLCSGYGGLDLAVERMFNAETAWFCEVDPKAAGVFAAHWPGLRNYRDLKMTHFGRVPKVDILTAGYPCQPFSHAGRRNGTDDPRHLWPFIAEAVRRIRPGHVVLENVAGHRSLGFDCVLGDLASFGYDVRWTSLRAAEVGAPHGRERLFIVASDAGGEAVRLGAGLRTSRTPRIWGRRSDDNGISGSAADTSGAGWQGSGPEPAWRGPERGGCAPADAERGRLDGRASDTQRCKIERTATTVSGKINWGQYRPAIERWERLTRPAPAPTEPATRGGQRLSPRFVEWMMGLPAGWVCDVPGLSRNDMLRILGNGVVPQQAVEALRRLASIDAAERVA